MPETWEQDYQLLLVFKDSLQEPRGTSFPVPDDSPTIRAHKSIVETLGRSPSTRPQQVIQSNLFISPDLGNRRCSIEVEPETCIWGWWRKPWETHYRTLAMLRDACSQGVRPKVLLYNQYYRWIYRAQLRAVYFEPSATSVRIPQRWWMACPKYYRDTPRLCGAFFMLKIEDRPVEDPLRLLGSLYVDSSSFGPTRPNALPVVQPPEGVLETCQRMVDLTPSRDKLRTSEQTMLVLRTYKQEELTRSLLETSDEVTNEQLAGSFEEMAWRDTLRVLRGASVLGWARLARAPEALDRIGRNARLHDSRVTRLDLELLALAFANAVEYENLLVTTQPDSDERMSDVGKSLVRWALASSERDSREAAADVFLNAWRFAMNRYAVGNLAEYFKALPHLEAIASAAQHEIGGKIYRDHLSHNVRCALLSSSLLESHSLNEFDNVKARLITFFSGLYHDIAFPVSTFPDTVSTLAEALKTVRLCHSGFMSQSLIDRSTLRKSLSVVGLLAAVPDVVNALSGSLFSPWEDPAAALDSADKRLLFEELLCASSEEHALISAAILFNLAVEGRSSNFDAGIRTLMGQMTGPSASSSGKELLCILQSIALHDRKPATHHHDVPRTIQNAPKPLEWDSFYFPSLVSVADDLQEWGRPIGELDQMVAVDATIQVQPAQVTAEFSLSNKSSTFRKTPFSVLEYLYGKIRNLGPMHYQNRPTSCKLALSNLDAFRLESVGGHECRLEFQDEFSFISFPFPTGPSNGSPTRSIEVPSGAYLLAIVSEDKELHETCDYLLIRGERSSVEHLASAARRCLHLVRLAASDDTVEVEFTEGITAHARAISHRFGRLGKLSTPTDTLNHEDPVALLEVELSEPLGTTSVNGLHAGAHLIPRAHFLDSDWRFTERTCRSLIRFARHHRDGLDICYLGCPSLALWHHLLFPEEQNWILLDRGHYALQCWVGDTMPAERVVTYDVAASLPRDYKGHFGIVIADAPWYDVEYRLFCRRAREAVTADGIIGTSDYPGYDPEKLKRFKSIRREVFGEHAWFASTEIDYSIPDFERSWDGHLKFVHLASRAYRLAYMDFYQAGTVEDSISGREEAANQPLPRIVELCDGHYLRFRGSDSEMFPCSVKFATRNRLERMRSIPATLLGWGTRNTLVSQVDTADPDSIPVRSIEELVSHLNEWEESHIRS